MNKYIEYFTNYVFMNYDMDNELISKKYYHSIRVAKLMVLLASKLNLSDEDILLAFKIGLCHDLGRFHEVLRNGKFDNRAFDHGTYSNKILYNDLFVNYMNIDEHLLFRKAVYFHNKKDISDDLTKREELFVKLIRDADKIDIIGLRGEGKRLLYDIEPTDIVLNNYIYNKSIDINDIHSKTDTVLFFLSFIKNLYYDASFDLAIDGNYLNKLLNKIDVLEERKEEFSKVIENLNERRGKVYVR